LRTVACRTMCVYGWWFRSFHVNRSAWNSPPREPNCRRDRKFKPEFCI
jgi:hypothetical protein